MKHHALTLFLTLLCTLSFASTKQQYQVSICSIFRDEAEYLKEWIEYHKLIGIDHFYLYDNESLDSPEIILDPYIKKGVVTLLKWPNRTNEDNEPFWALTTQITAYEHAAKVLAKNETKWLVCLDVQEFLVPSKNYRSIKHLLQKYDNYPGITFSTECFDGYCVDFSPQKKLVIESNKIILKPKQNLCKLIEKTLFKPKLYTSFIWPPQKLRFKNGEALSLDKKELKINCYANRFKGYLDHKRNDYVVDGSLLTEKGKECLLKAGFAIEDTKGSIQRFLPMLQKQLQYED